MKSKCINLKDYQLLKILRKYVSEKNILNYVIEKVKEKGTITTDDIKLPLSYVRKRILLSMLTKQGILERVTGLKSGEEHTAYKLNERSYRFLKEFLSLVEKTVSGEIFKERPIELPSDTLIEFL